MASHSATRETAPSEAFNSRLTPPRLGSARRRGWLCSPGARAGLCDRPQAEGGCVCGAGIGASLLPPGGRAGAQEESRIRKKPKKQLKSNGVFVLDVGRVYLFTFKTRFEKSCRRGTVLSFLKLCIYFFGAVAVI